MQVALSYLALATALFLFPPDCLVTGNKMSECCIAWWIDGSAAVLTRLGYCIVALAIIVMIFVLHWIIRGRKHFHGPRTMAFIDHNGVDNIQQQTLRNSADIQIKPPPG